MGLVLTPLFTNSFQGANQNPLDATNWFEIGEPGNDVLQILNAKCTTTVLFEDDGTASFIPSLPDDQFIEVTLTEDLDTLGALFLYARGIDENLGTCYAFDIAGPIGDTTGLSGWGLNALNEDGENIPYTWVDFQTREWNVGDRLALAVVGQAAGKIYFLVNEQIVFEGALNLNPDGVYASGKMGMQLATIKSPPSPTDIGVINFRAGSAALANSVTRGTRSK